MSESTSQQLDIKGIIKQINNNDKKKDILDNYKKCLDLSINSDDLDYLTDNLKENYFYDFIKISREKNNQYIAFNLDYSYCNFLCEKGDLEKAFFIAEDSLKFNSGKSFNNDALDLFYRVKDHILIKREILKIDEKIQKERFKIIEILGFFVTILAFIFSSIQILTKIQDYNEAKNFLILIISGLLLFLSLLILVFSNWKEEKIKSIISISFIISILIFLFIIK